MAMNVRIGCVSGSLQQSPSAVTPIYMESHVQETVIV